MLTHAIRQLIARQSLPFDLCESVFNTVLSGEADCYQFAALLILLRAKGESEEEIFAMIHAIRQRSNNIPLKEPALDIVGTGGDGENTINISTGSAILAAACGVRIAKHGNKAVTSRCGSADVLTALGVNIQINPDRVAHCIRNIGIGFYFHPRCYTYLPHIQTVRKSLGIPTCFNLIGPLLNPASPSHYLLGVYSKTLIDLFANLLIKLAVKRAVVFHGNGLDEISCAATTHMVEVHQGKKKYFDLNPGKYGFSRCSINDLRGGSPRENADILLNALSGAQGPVADTLILNAAMAVYLFGLTHSLPEAIEIARDKQQSGKAIDLLNRWIAFTQETSDAR